MYQWRFRPVKHLKMTIWTSVLWKMNILRGGNGQKWSYNCHLWGTFISNESLVYCEGIAWYMLHLFWVAMHTIHFFWVETKMAQITNCQSKCKHCFVLFAAFSQTLVIMMYIWSYLKIASFTIRFYSQNKLIIRLRFIKLSNYKASLLMLLIETCY